MEHTVAIAMKDGKTIASANAENFEGARSIAIYWLRQGVADVVMVHQAGQYPRAIYS